MFQYVQKFTYSLALFQFLLVGETFPVAHGIESDPDFFYYFGYGSNLLTERIKQHNPTAVRIGAAAVKHYRLDFGNWSKTWLGPVATIVPELNSTVYGVVWQIDKVNLADLDKQEGVPFCYKRIYIPVLLTNGTAVDVLTYSLLNLHKGDDYDRRPTSTLIKCMIRGAKEAGIPEDYIHAIKTIDYSGIIVADKERKFDLENIELPEREAKKEADLPRELDSRDPDVVETVNPHFVDSC